MQPPLARHCMLVACTGRHWAKACVGVYGVHRRHAGGRGATRIMQHDAGCAAGSSYYIYEIIPIATILGFYWTIATKRLLKTQC